MLVFCDGNIFSFYLVMGMILCLCFMMGNILCFVMGNIQCLCSVMGNILCSCLCLPYEGRANASCALSRSCKTQI